MQAGCLHPVALCCAQFAVQYDHRAAPSLDRMAVINLFANKIKVRWAARRAALLRICAALAAQACWRRTGAVAQRALAPRSQSGPPLHRRPSWPPRPAAAQQAPHKVDLGAPQKTILVNLLKSACGVAVVEQYRELQKFNIHMLTMTPEEREAAAEKAGGGKQQQARQPEPEAGAAGEAGGAAGPEGGGGGGGEGEAAGAEQQGQQQQEAEQTQEQEQQAEEQGGGAPEC